MPVCRIIVSLEHSGHEHRQIGFTELITDKLLAQCLEGTYGGLRAYYLSEYRLLIRGYVI